jgi:hypothetical protein
VATGFRKAVDQGVADFGSKLCQILVSQFFNIGWGLDRGK